MLNIITGGDSSTREVETLLTEIILLNAILKIVFFSYPLVRNDLPAATIFNYIQAPTL
jgi:hypothetical protein